MNNLRSSTIFTIILSIAMLSACVEGKKPGDAVQLAIFDLGFSMTDSTVFREDSIKQNQTDEDRELVFDLEDIIERDTLRAIITYSSTSYFIHKGEPMGYEYELVQNLAEHLGLNLKLIVAHDMDAMIGMLLRGEGDLIAHGLTITKSRKEIVSFSLPHNTTQQVLVQRMPENWRKMKRHVIDRGLIRNPVDLIGKTVSVRSGSSYYSRLENLSEEIGDDIEIDVVSGELSTDELIEKVAHGELDLTIADQNIALISQTYFDQIDIETSVSLLQQLAWAVRKSSPSLLEAIDEWIAANQKKSDYHVIYNKYFKNKRAFRTRLKSDFYSLSGGKLSPYDERIKQHAEQLGWDWRLLASLIYQESHFDPKTKSWVGAGGLMQLMPATAREMGIRNVYKPADNLKAGSKYLGILQDQWQSIPDSANRTKFTMASYNVGPGHVQDAQRLAEKLGKNPQVWEANVEACLLLKSKPKYYNDPVVKYGYCRGKEPVAYVKGIVERYDIYKDLLK